MLPTKLFRGKRLYLVGGIFLLTILLFNPSLIANFTGTEQFPPVAQEQSIFIRRFYDIEQWFKDVTRPELYTEYGGIRKPHPPQKSRAQRLKLLHLFNEIPQRQPWPRFSPGRRPMITKDELSNVNSSSTPSTTSEPEPFINFNNSGYLIQELYRAGYLWPHPELCKDGTDDIQLLIIVTSPPPNKRARNAIRRTWGDYAKNHGVVLAFLLGRPSPKMLSRKLLQEDNIYGDLILNNMRESHVNTTLKAISLLEWAKVFCPNAQTLLKTNDNVYINVPRLLDFIWTSRVNETKTIWGKIKKNIHPERRNLASQYYLSQKEFPNTTLPDFVMGAAYLMSSAAIQSLCRMAARLPFLRLDDVFITGILAEAAGVQREHVDDFFKYNWSRNTCDIRNAISFEKVQYKEMRNLSEKIELCMLTTKN